jgi:hypothetical protein
MPDHAIVVGISSYFGLPGLKGPDNDAAAIRDWLIDPAGGGLDSGNVALIRSLDFPAPTGPDDAQPEKRAIDRAFKALIKKAQAQVPVGDCLYVYMSGHGFSPKLEEGAIFTADFDFEARYPAHVYVSAWLEWFRTAGYFKRYVLWMDCCVERQWAFVPERPALLKQVAQGAPPPAFVAMAVRAGKALEREFEGKVHGVFTWTLLHGLKGAARDEHGRITGQSLRTYLLNALRDNLPEEVRNAQDVDTTPFVPPPEDGFVFGQAAPPPDYVVRLKPTRAPEQAVLQIWGGQAPFAKVSEGPIIGGAWQGRLPRGLYIAEIEGAGRFAGFEVTGSGDVDLPLALDGPPVDRANAGAPSFRLWISSHAAATLSLIDSSFDRVLVATGLADTRQPPGVYKVRVQFGRGTGGCVDRVLLLDRDTSVDILEPPLRSAAPIPGTALTHEYHVDVYEEVARVPLTDPDKARIVVVGRNWTEQGAGAVDLPHPLAGVRLVGTRGRAVVRDLMAEANLRVAQILPQPDAIAAAEIELAPGAYFLRHALAQGRILMQTLIAVGGWNLEVYLRREANDLEYGEGGAAFARSAQLAILMRKPGRRDLEHDRLVEAARIALAQGRNLLAEDRGADTLNEFLFFKWKDPIAGIVGAHLLARAIDAAGEKASTKQRDLYDKVVCNLRKLVGTSHPDVEALSLRCADPTLRATGPFSLPPMFEASWQHIVARSRKAPGIVAPELYRRVHALVPQPPFLLWAADEGTRRAHARQLQRWVRQEQEERTGTGPRRSRRQGSAPQPANAFEAVIPLGATAIAKPPDEVWQRASGLGMPMGVLDELWSGATKGKGP